MSECFIYLKKKYLDISLWYNSNMMTNFMILDETDEEGDQKHIYFTIRVGTWKLDINIHFNFMACTISN